jgi:hypothetical protein
MTIKHRQIRRKEILPCHCMRYVYEHDLDIVYCTRHSKIITGRLDQPEVQKLLRKLYTDPPFRPKSPNRFWEYAEVTKIIGSTMAIIVAMSLMLCALLYATLAIPEIITTNTKTITSRKDDAITRTPSLPTSQNEYMDLYKKTTPWTTLADPCADNLLSGDNPTNTNSLDTYKRKTPLILNPPTLNWGLTKDISKTYYEIPARQH